MKKKEQPEVKFPIGMLVMHGIVILLVLYLFCQLFLNYLAGGPEAPPLAVVAAGGVLLIGGSLFVGFLAVRIFLKTRNQR